MVKRQKGLARNRTMRVASVFFLICLCLLKLNCTYPQVSGPRAQRYKRPVRTFYGKASFYGPKFHGRKTANGEVFDQHKLTAAHKTWPFNTKIRVTNQKNGKKVVVRINDRGPFIEGRMLDLSYGAAKAINGVRQGVMDVRIDILEWGKKKP